MTQLSTERLVMRRSGPADLAPLAAMNADPQVMKHFPEPLSADGTARMMARIEAHFEREGFGVWTLERRDTGEVIGLAGLARPQWDAHFMPAVEIAWRLARHAWGKGYASEAARRALAFGFGEMGLGEIVSFTATCNLRSMAVMERIGMRRDAQGDFDMPVLPAGHRLRRHVLYRLDAKTFLGQPSR